MSKMLTVLRQEYLIKVRSKAFLFGTFVMPILMGGLFVLPGVLLNVGVGKPTTLAVVDESGVLLPLLIKSLPDTAKTGEKLYTLEEEPAAGRDPETLARDLGVQVAQKHIGGFFIIPADAVEKGKISYYATNVSDFRTNQRFDRAIEKAIREVRMERSRLDTAQVAAILKEVSLTTFKVQEGGKARKDQGATFGLAYVVGFIFYFSLIFYGSMMLRATLEEKTSRSAEVMVATVRPFQLMGGKILGIGALGLTQYGIWAIIVGLFSLYGASWAESALGSNLDLSQIGLNASIVAFAIVYFIVGFLFYSSLFGAVGAMVSSETEAQQLQFPLMLPIILAFMLMFLAIRDPNGIIVRVASFIPFFAPIIMMARICVVMPPAWEIGLSLVIMMFSIWGAIWVAGRIFRVGILMYGKRPDLPELMKWIRYG